MKGKIFLILTLLFTTIFYGQAYELYKDTLLNVATSPDKKVKIYTYEYPNEGTMSSYSNIIEFRENGKLYKFKGSLHKFLGEEGEDYIHDYVEKIYSIRNQKGETIYYALRHYKSWGNYATDAITAFTLKKGKGYPNKIFKTKDGKLTHDISICYEVSDWFFRIKVKDNWDRLFYTKNHNRTIYWMRNNESEGRETDVDLEGGMEKLTGAYDQYVFDGNIFRFKRAIGDPNIYPSIQNYAVLISEFKTRGYRIRLHRLKDGGLQYICWKKSRPVTSKPDLILNNGVKKKNLYIFTTKDGYEYSVNSIFHDAELKVKKNGKTLLQQKCIPEYKF